MEISTKKNFREATCLKKIWNRIIKWNGLTLAFVAWHDLGWKVIDNSLEANEENHSIIAERTYQPIAEFHTQEELWQYLKSTIV